MTLFATALNDPRNESLEMFNRITSQSRWLAYSSVILLGEAQTAKTLIKNLVEVSVMHRNDKFS